LISKIPSHSALEYSKIVPEKPECVQIVLQTVNRKQREECKPQNIDPLSQETKPGKCITSH